MLVIWHLLRAAFGYIAATLAAALVVAASPALPSTAGLYLSRDLQDLLGETGTRLTIGLADVAIAGFPTIGFVFVFTVAIAASEAWSLRALWTWIIAGGLAGLGLAYPVDLATTGPSPAAASLLPFVAAGFAAGLVYWLIAGRRAGTWRRALPPPDVT